MGPLAPLDKSTTVESLLAERLAVLQALRNPLLKDARLAVSMAYTYFAQAPGADGWRNIPLHRLTAHTGVLKAAASEAVNRLQVAGWLERTVLKEVTRRGPRQRTMIRLSAASLLLALQALAPLAPPKTMRAKPTPATCPEHPDSYTITDHDTRCGVCATPLLHRETGT